MVKQLTTKLLVFAVILLSSLTMFAQSGAVTGVVTDAGDGTSLPGATIVIKGTTKGAVTDIDGNYTINAEANQVLVFSYVGYASQEFVAQPNSTINVALQSSALSLEGVVVIGYGVTKKEDATGSVTAISTESFNKGAIVTPAALITGKIAGVQVTSGSGAPGSSSSIVIRGGSSLSASNDALIVIDGVPVSHQNVGGSRSVLNTINPNDIETFTVLKDASATAIYGSRASNGVIIITTKRGSVGKPLQINYTGKFSYFEIPETLSVLSSDEFKSTIDTRFPERTDMLGTWTNPEGNMIPYTSLPEDRTGFNQTIHNTNWQDEIYENSTSMDHGLSLTGAWKTMPYRVSIGYTDENGVLKTSNFKRTTLSASLNPTLFDDFLKINFSINGSFIDNTFANTGAIGAAIQMDPTKPVHNLNGEYGGYWAWLQTADASGVEYPVTQGTTNPMSLINLQDNTANVNRVYGNLQLDYKLHFFSDLHVNANLSYDKTKSNGTNKVPQYATWSFNSAQGGGTDNKYDSEYTNGLADFYLNYIKDLPSIKSNFNVMAGTSVQKFYESSNNYNSNAPIINDSSTQIYLRDTVINKSELNLLSYFGRLNYVFNKRFLLTASVRADGTSRFSPDNRWGIFPAVAFGWKINEEAFLRDSKVITQLKLRLGWGVTGQQDVGGYYDYMGRYTYGNQYAMYPFGDNYYITLRPEGYNENLRWEETTTWNIGVDYAILSNRIYGSIDVYKRKTVDLLSWVPAVAGSNLSNFINRNIGELENKGVEFAINGKIISNEKMFWDLGFNTTYNKNEITVLYDGFSIPTGGISGGVGNMIQEQAVGQPRNAFFVYEQVYDNDGMPIENLYVDRNGDGEITTADKYYYKDPTANFYLGISSNFSYKEWSFSFAGRANFGNYVYNNVQSENGWYNRLYRPEGPYLGNIVSGVTNTNFESEQYHSDYYVQDASFFKMDNITLSYTFANLMKNRVKLQLSATVNNAFTITNYTGIDPEVGSGIDGNVYPRTRIWMFGVNLIF